MTMNELSAFCVRARKSKDIKSRLNYAESFVALAETQRKNALGARFYLALALVEILASLSILGVDDIEDAITKAVHDEESKATNP